MKQKRVVKGVIPTSSYIGSQQMDEFENNHFGSGYNVGNINQVFDIRLKENFKLFVSGPPRCGKTVFISKLLENINTFAKIPPHYCNICI